MPSKDASPEQKALGRRFKTLREVAGLTQDEAAVKLEVTKGGLSAWEVGRNMPNPFMLRKMAKLYGVSVDALLWDDSLSPDAMKFAAQYDNLSGKQRGIFEAMWMAYFEQAAEDETVAQTIGPAPDVPPRRIQKPSDYTPAQPGTKEQKRKT